MAHLNRCSWCGQHSDYVSYHDEEWGVPETNDHVLFELLTLEGAQAGLSWLTILRKREGYRKAFAKFDPSKVAGFSERDIVRLQADATIVRNKLKISSTVTNAAAFLNVMESHGTFANFIWDYVDGIPIQNEFGQLSDLPAQTALAEQISKDLKKLGFRFVGPTITYAFMQAAGMVNDHVTSCFRRVEVARLGEGRVV
ncbi:MAG: DNA-3-methyladenine glycosylase I [Rhodothermales bacterium]|nr:DNA-3-methyladenine glycosylase I [Rhodothermales bacterium]